MAYFLLEAENNIFKSLVVDLTHRCNMHCANCYIPNRSIPDMDRDKLIKFIKRLPFKTFVRLIGAEPTMREDLPYIIREVKKAGHHPSLTTNGLKLSDYNYLKTLWKSGLKLFLISMNGADEDIVYKKIDNGCYAKQKVQALENLFKIGAFINVGCIIAKGINEHLPSRLIQLVTDTANKYNYKFNGSWRSPCIRFKNIGAIGRYMNKGQFSFDELIRVVSDQLQINKSLFLDNPCVSGSNLSVPYSSKIAKDWFIDENANSYMTTLQTSAGPLYIRLIDWTANSEGVPQSGSKNRGRITKDWKIAPFFEDKKIHEFQY